MVREELYKLCGRNKNELLRIVYVHHTLNISMPVMNPYDLNHIAAILMQLKSYETLFKTPVA
jgi:hypothetical protein